MSWQSSWPVAHPRRSGAWTVRRGSVFGVLDPESGKARTVDPSADRKLPGLAAAMAEGDLIGYRYGRRAIVATPTHFIKVVRPSRVDALVERHQWAEAEGHRFSTPVVSEATGDGRVALSRVPGRSLHEQLRTEPTRDVSDIARLAVSLQNRPAPAHLAVRRCDEAFDWVETSRRSPTPLLGSIERVAEELPLLAERSDVVVHGDLHDKNIFCSSSVGGDRLEQMGLIDLDGLALGAVEDDVVNLAVHLELRNLQGGMRHPAGLRSRAFYEAYRHAGGSLDLERVRLLERHTWFRLACLYQYRASSVTLAPLFLRAAGLDAGKDHRDLRPSVLAGADLD